MKLEPFFRGRRVAALQAQLDMTKLAAKRAVFRAYDNGRDGLAADLITLLHEMQESGASDEALLDAVLETALGRLEVGLPPEGWFAGSGADGGDGSAGALS